MLTGVCIPLNPRGRYHVNREDWGFVVKYGTVPIAILGFAAAAGADL